ncbi:MAG: GH92 family glycosyl hydrolase [Flavobacteriales bacterium]|nr:GH92 family glycosyl hydrolase [Flavobacteriales bacterium]
MRGFLLTSSLLFSSAGVLVHAQVNYAKDLVNPFIGTGGHGHTFPGACVPNGLVQLSPDTRTDGYNDWDGCGGYHYSDSIIYGFSHTHLSGTGVADLCDVLLTPVAGSGGMAFDGAATRSRFSHASEVASAGYYKVDLLGPPPSPVYRSSVQAARPTRIEGSSIRAELTATARVGVHRYTFPKGQAARIVLDLSHRDNLLGRSIQKVSETEVVGERRSSSWAKDQRLFFCIRFSSPIQNEDVLPSNLVGLGAGYGFGALEQPLIVKVGISAVSIDGARANLEAEVPHWDFDLVRKQAEDSWNKKLSKIQVDGGIREQQRIFYTALYHSYVAPYIFNDVDGHYRGMDGQVRHADHNVYTVFSLWDTFRALHPLMTILEPEMTNDFINTFLLHYQQGGRLPVWELWGNETDCMIGYHSVSVIADAHAKGIRDYDDVLALKAMLASATRDEPGLKALSDKGYISSEDQSESVSKTLEYAYNDRCIVSMASEMNIPEDTLHTWKLDLLDHRGRAFENLFDPTTGFFRARRNGGFVPSFDPYEVNFNYTEANAWQYSLFAPQAFKRLIELHSGPSGFERHLDSLFSASSTTSGREQADITGLIGQYAHGNEPSHHMAYLYNLIGKPKKTRALVKRIMGEQYHDAPDGLSGNEDCGQMSAWYVMSALGLYPVSPGISTEYQLGYPLFGEARIAVGDSSAFTIDVRDSTWVRIRETAAQLESKDKKKRPKTKREEQVERIDELFGKNERHHTPTTLDHADIRKGGRFEFDVDRVPQRMPYVPEISSGPGDSAGPGNGVPGSPRPGAPVIVASASTFTDTLLVAAEGKGTCTIEDQLGQRVCPMNKPFALMATARIDVTWSEAFEPVTAQFTKIDGSRTIKLESPYANQYAAGGDHALIDGLRGGTDFRTGEWQGFREHDVLATLDLGSVKKLQRAGLSVLQDQNSWIFYPAEVTFAWSTNGRTWSSTTVANEVDRRNDLAEKQELWTPLLGKKARYVKVIAKNAGVCPDWHKGKGGTTWIFADEILIEAE